MKRELDKVYKLYPEIKADFDKRQLDTLVADASRYGAKGLTKHMMWLDNSKIKLVASFLGMERAILENRFYVVAELSAVFFSHLVKEKMFDEAERFGRNMCLPTGGYTRAVILLLDTCDNLLEWEKEDAEAVDKIKAIKESINGLYRMNLGSLQKNDAVFHKQEIYSNFERLVTKILMWGALVLAVVLFVPKFF